MLLKINDRSRMRCSRGWTRSRRLVTAKDQRDYRSREAWCKLNVVAECQHHIEQYQQDLVKAAEDQRKAERAVAADFMLRYEADTEQNPAGNYVCAASDHLQHKSTDYAQHYAHLLHAA